MALKDLPTTFLEHAINANPGVKEFSWGNTRKEIEAELKTRYAQARYTPPRVPKVPTPLPRDLEYTTKQPAKPFTPAGEFEQHELTVLIFTSPVRSHPSAWILENVYNSIRRQMPDVRIVILADGVKGDEPWEYAEYKKEVRCRGWEIREFSGPHHQTLMLRDALLDPGFITTPLVMVVEHDWGIKPLYIDWLGITVALLDPASKINLIQLRQERADEWEYGFFGELKTFHDVNLLPTTCFQCPTHIARTDWYRKQVESLKRPDFLEGDELTDGLRATGEIRNMTCYIPTGPMGRLYHLNGREVLSASEMDGIGAV